MLDKSNIEYMINGSVALTYYVEPRMKRDIDIVLNLNSSDIQKMMKLFKSGFYIDENMMKEAIRHQSMFTIIHLEALVIPRKGDRQEREEREERMRTRHPPRS